MFRSAFVALILASVLVYPDLASSAELSVKVKRSKLRVEPKHWGRTLESVTYGQRVEEIERDGQWYKVKIGNGTVGYLHETAVTTKKVILKSTGQVDASSEDDVMLAGKGFSKSTESRYRSENKSMNFRAVDAMERFSISDRQLSKFITDGKLGDEG